jgi:hypothetical protein
MEYIFEWAATSLGKFQNLKFAKKYSNSWKICNGQQDVAVHCSAWIAKSRAKVGDLAIPLEHLRLQHVSDYYRIGIFFGKF